jgi:nitroimidazol reductase NimA-like FMN-containing flavoprotein (pyridoxamine 5'-phosphate oxidase superfamily)
MRIARLTALASIMVAGFIFSATSVRAVSIDDLARQYAEYGYTVAEIALSEDDETYKVEATFGDAKIEIVVDAESGEVIKAEAERKGVEYHAVIDPRTGELIFVEEDDEAEREREEAEEAAEREREEAEEAAEREREEAEGS